MKNLTLVALMSWKKKDGEGSWYRALLKGHNSQGKPVTGEFFLSEEVGEKAVKDGLVEDCPVNVTFDFNDYMKPVIVSISKALVATTKGGTNA